MLIKYPQTFDPSCPLFTGGQNVPHFGPNFDPSRLQTAIFLNCCAEELFMFSEYISDINVVVNIYARQLIIRYYSSNYSINFVSAQIHFKVNLSQLQKCSTNFTNYIFTMSITRRQVLNLNHLQLQTTILFNSKSICCLLITKQSLHMNRPISPMT